MMLSLAPLASRADLIEGDYTYTVTEGQATITDFNTSYSGALSITNTLGGCPVTCIGHFALSGCSHLTSVTIVDSVGMIGDLAFYNCVCMTNVMIGSGVTNIGTFAFLFCEGLAHINLPNNVATVGDGAFAGCSSMTNVVIGSSVSSIGADAFSSSVLSAISVSEDNPHYSDRDGILFNKDQTALLQYPRRRPGNHYTILSGVTTIGKSAFDSCSALVSITIADSVASIGHNAFRSCASLTSLAIPDDIASIGDYTFYYCTSLTSLFFKGNVPTLGGNVFDYVPATVYYLPGTAGWGETLGGRPTLCWNPTVANDSSFGFATNRFGFNIVCTSDIPIVVESSTNLSSGAWAPLLTNMLGSSGSLYFSDPSSNKYPARFYRIVWP